MPTRRPVSRKAEDTEFAQFEQKRADANAKLAGEKADAAVKCAHESDAAKALAEQHLYVAHMNSPSRH